MTLTPCRECRSEVSTDAPVCPRCGAPQPWRSEWRGYGIDWRTKASIWGYPLIHVSFGRDARGKPRIARGVVAIGQVAVGLIVIAQFGVGFLLGIGQFVFGLAALAQFAVGILCGVGQFATGYVAVGQFAVGCIVIAHWGFAPHFLLSALAGDPRAAGSPWSARTS
jgi:RNA polymerase subunit RPABC4/transcription elongation factor Spt4